MNKKKVVKTFSDLPEWAQLCSNHNRLWIEDDAIPKYGHEDSDANSVSAAWKKLFGTSFNSDSAIYSVELSDCIYKLYPDNVVVIFTAYREDSIHKIKVNVDIHRDLLNNIEKNYLKSKFDIIISLITIDSDSKYDLINDIIKDICNDYSINTSIDLHIEYKNYIFMISYGIDGEDKWNLVWRKRDYVVKINLDSCD